MATATGLTQMPNRTLSMVFAEKYAIDQKNVFAILRETALKSKEPVSDAEVAAFMIVCNQYDLNPFIKEIFGFISKGKMQYVLSVDGWVTLANRQPNLNGIEFEEHFAGDAIRSITCKIHRKDRALPTVVTEYFAECRGETDNWKRWPIRMLRHKSLIQCARIAFGLAGIIDEDEAERMSDFPAPPPVLEGKSPTDPQADALMQQLGWAEGKRNSCRRNFASNPDGLISYLRAEVAKMGKPAAAKSQVVEAKPEPQQQEDAAEPQQEVQGEYIDAPAEYVQETQPQQQQSATRAGRRGDW